MGRKEDSLSEARDKRRDRVPVSKLFHERLMSFNNLDSLSFEEWIFHPAMLFGSVYKWWGDSGRRERPHEGLDLCLYRTKEGNIHHLPGEAKIPVLFNGQVATVTDDFLGESVFVSHDAYDSNGSQLYTVYGHMKLGSRVRPGERLLEGDIIGVIADTGNREIATPDHLHISVAWIPHTVHVPERGWQAISDPMKVVLLDPLSVIRWPYSIVSQF